VGVKPFGATDPPGVLIVSREASSSSLDLALALLIKPFEAIKFREFVRQDIAKFREVKNVERGVVEKLFRERALGPVGFLGVFVERYTKVLLQQRGQANTLAIEELRSKHGVEHALCSKPAQVMEQAQIKITAVHEQVFFCETIPERFEIDLRKYVDEINFSSDEKLQQADACAVVEEIIGLRIDRRFLGPIESGEEWR